MIDPATIFALAASAVTLLSPVLEKIRDGGAEEVGKALVDKFKGIFAKEAKTQEALADLAVEPGDKDNQAALRKELKKALNADPALVTALQALLAEHQEAAPSGVTQTANVSGNQSVVIQVSGSGNKVTH